MRNTLSNICIYHFHRCNWILWNQQLFFREISPLKKKHPKRWKFRAKREHPNKPEHTQKMCKFRNLPFNCIVVSWTILHSNHVRAQCSQHILDFYSIQPTLLVHNNELCAQCYRFYSTKSDVVLCHSSSQWLRFIVLDTFNCLIQTLWIISIWYSKERYSVLFNGDFVCYVHKFNSEQ